jgi:hypothetical protein
MASMGRSAYPPNPLKGLSEEVRFAGDSPLEQSGFEL